MSFFGALTTFYNPKTYGIGSKGGSGWHPDNVGPGAHGFGFDYTPTATPGMPGQVSQGFGQAAQTLIQGSQLAQTSLQKAYESMFMSRYLGTTTGFGENEKRLGAETSATGLSPDLVRAGAFQRGIGLNAAIGMDQGEEQFGYNQDVAKLQQGTGTELATLKDRENSMNLQAYLAKQGIKSAGSAVSAGLTGDLLGAVGTIGGAIVGGPIGAGIGAGLAKAATPPPSDSTGAGVYNPPGGMWYPDNANYG